MRYLRFLLLFLTCFGIAAAGVYGFDDLPKDRMNVTINGGDAYIETLDGVRYGLSPFTQNYYSEIPGILKTTEGSKTMIDIPADQLYGFWLERSEDKSDGSFSTEIQTAEWWVGLSDFKNNTDTFDLLVSPKSTFLDSGPVFDKITVNAFPAFFPDFRIEFRETKRICNMRMDTIFNIDEADPAVSETLAEMVVTYYSDDNLVSVWAVSSDPNLENLFSGSAFQFNIALSCEEDQNVREIKSPQFSMKENGIFFIDLDDFLSGGEAYFEGDLDGDDEYEVEPCSFSDLIRTDILI